MFVKSSLYLLLILYIFNILAMATDMTPPTTLNKTQDSIEQNFTFTTTHWRLIYLGKNDINASMLSREAHIVFSPLVEGKANFHGASGCNDILGQYMGKEQNLTIDNTHIAMTRMACPDMKVETQFLHVLGDTTHWEMKDTYLAFFDNNHTVIAGFKAVKK